MTDFKIAHVDLESTGVSITKDRIVQIAAVKTTADLLERDEVKKYLVNPGIPIPPAATEVHGITDEMVKDARTFKQIARALYLYLEPVDAIAGFNSNKFDVPLLSEEFARVGIAWPKTDIKLLDAFTIYREKEKRDLGAAVNFYLNREHTGAHDAEADILATVDILGAQMVRYDDLSDMGITELDGFCGGNIRVDLAGTIVLNKQGVAVYNLGKAKGTAVVQDPGFGRWMLAGDFSGDTKSVVRRLLGL